MIVECVQGTPEWLHARVGKVTGSRMADVQSYLQKGGDSQRRKNYKAEIICELLTGRAQEHYVTPAMEWGLEQEVFARAEYELATDSSIDMIGFAVHPVIDRFGASPDGLIGDDGLVEFKCPTTATHIEYVLAGVVPEEYKPQMLAEMACTERKWCDFMSFDPRLPFKLQRFIRRYERDDEKISAMEDEVLKFLEEVAETIFKLTGKEVQSEVLRSYLPTR